jgi:hypothetical protein
MRIRFRKSPALFLGILISASVALSDPKDKADKKDPHSGDRAKSASTHVGVGIFMEGDRDLIRRHYLTSQGALPPGLAKRQGELPPGLAKQLRRNGHLPPGLEKKLDPFPVELERRLPPLRPGLVRGMIGAHAVILDPKTSLIVDVFRIP